MIIRKATIKDLDEISSVELQCFPVNEAATKEDFVGRLKEYKNNFWLLEEEGKIVSFINGMVSNECDICDEMYKNPNMHNENGKWQMVFGVNTLPRYRKRGLAGKLINKVISEAIECGREGIALTCKEEMIHYYEGFGFKNKGISKSIHGGVVWYDMKLTFENNNG